MKEKTHKNQPFIYTIMLLAGAVIGMVVDQKYGPQSGTIANLQGQLSASRAECFAPRAPNMPNCKKPDVALLPKGCVFTGKNNSWLRAKSPNLPAI
jgi:hypothetical protein